MWALALKREGGLARLSTATWSFLVSSSSPCSLSGSMDDAAASTRPPPQLQSSLKQEQTQEMKEYDIWRDSLLRYMGYANELGESFRPLMPRLVVPSYVAAFGYVLGDTLDKTKKAQKHMKVSTGLSKNQQNAFVASQAVDTLVWQTMASVAIPGFTINRVVAFSGFAIKKAAIQNPIVKRWVPTAMGLGVIPFIVHPIDHFVDTCMDRSVRKWMKDYFDASSNKHARES